MPPPTQVPGRPIATTDAFEHAGGTNNYLIPAATVTGSGLDSDGARWARVKDLTLQDMFHILGFRKSDDIGPRIRKLQLSDIHAIGKTFNDHYSMEYPDKIYSCCCCG